MAKNKNKTTEAAQPATDEVPFQVDDLVETAIVAAPAAPVGLAAADEDFDYGTDYAGSEMKLKADEIIIPMIKIIQESSTIWKDRDEETFEGQVGDLYNTVSRTVYKAENGLLLVPIKETYCVIEREDSTKGTFIAKHSAELDEKKGGEPRVIQAYKDNGPDGWKRLKGKSADGKKVQFSYTVEVYCALIDPTDGFTATGVVMLPFAGTNVFQRKRWWSAMGEVLGAGNTPKYAFRTLMKTVFRPGKDGGVDSYMFDAQPYGGNWSRCRLSPKAHKETLDRCKEFAKLLDSGALGKADYTEPEASETDAENASFTVDGKAPF